MTGAVTPPPTYASFVWKDAMNNLMDSKWQVAKLLSGDKDTEFCRTVETQCHSGDNIQLQCKYRTDSGTQQHNNVVRRYCELACGAAGKSEATDLVSRYLVEWYMEGKGQTLTECGWTCILATATRADWLTVHLAHRCSTSYLFLRLLRNSQTKDGWSKIS